MRSPLSKLGLRKRNPGLFDGHGRGTGPEIDSLSPIDDAPIAAVRDEVLRVWQHVAPKPAKPAPQLTLSPAPRSPRRASLTRKPRRTS